MKTTPEPIEFVVSFHPDATPPVGTVRDSTGREQPFEGWLGLLHLLETRGQTTAREAAPANEGDDA